MEACPPSTAYRFKKFVRRNKGQVIAAGFVAVALLLGLVGTAWQAKVARRERDNAVKAQIAEAGQRKAAEEQRRTADEQRDRAVKAEAEIARRAAELQKVADFQAQMLAQVDPTSAGVRLTDDVHAQFAAALGKSGIPDEEQQPQQETFANQWSRVNATDTARKLIDSTILQPAVAAIDVEFADQPVVAASLRNALAERYHDLGLDEMALTLERQALSERRRVLGPEHDDTLISTGNMGAFLSALGRYDDAESYYREALEKSRRVRGNESPETLTCIANMAEPAARSGQNWRSGTLLPRSVGDPASRAGRPRIRTRWRRSINGASC